MTVWPKIAVLALNFSNAASFPWHVMAVPGSQPFPLSFWSRQLGDKNDAGDGQNEEVEDWDKDDSTDENVGINLSSYVVFVLVDSNYWCISTGR